MGFKFKLYAILAALTFITLTGFYIKTYYSGKSAGKAVVKVEQLEQYKKDVEKNDNIEKEVKRMSTPELDANLARWLRPE